MTHFGLSSNGEEKLNKLLSPDPDDLKGGSIHVESFLIDENLIDECLLDECT